MAKKIRLRFGNCLLKRIPLFCAQISIDICKLYGYNQSMDTIVFPHQRILFLQRVRNIPVLTGG